MFIKRLIGLLLCLIFSFILLTGCKQNHKLVAIVIENNETSILVETDDGDRYLVSIEEDTVLLNIYSDVTQIDNFMSGDKVGITYDGVIIEGNPAQILRCYKIQLRRSFLF